MKILALAACAALLLVGCQSEDSGELKDLHIGLGPREAPKDQIFQADQKSTFEAARAVITGMGYTIEKSGAAQGEITALSSVSRGDPRAGERQISLRVKLTQVSATETDMEVSLTEIIAADSGGEGALATQTPLADPALYEDIFKKMERALAAPKVQ
jgi:hypothetical protein